MATHIIVNIQIEGMSDPVSPFTSLSIQQTISGHHHFELIVPVTVFDASGNPAVVNDSNRLIGKVITIEFSESVGGSMGQVQAGSSLNVFKGLVTEIVFNRFRGAQGNISIRGFSPTIVLENGPHFASFPEKTLKEIMTSVISDFNVNYLTSEKIDPVFTATIPFSVQYNESCYNYFKRLANKYGEWFYYDGSKLNVGQPGSGDEINLNFSQNVSDFNLSMRLVPLKFKKTSFDYTKSQTFSSDSSSVSADIGPFGNSIFDESQQVFSMSSNLITDSFHTNQSDLDRETSTLMKQRASNMVVLSGSCDNASVAVGKIINVSVMAASGSGTEDFGKYIVTNVSHRTDGLGNYQNHFQAIPHTVECPFIIPASEPDCEIESAIVKDNDDPDKLGRVRVQFRWQQGSDMTPFIRVATPYQGKKRGINFTPEIDDEVLVTFSDGNPDAPFVLGSLRNKDSEYSNRNIQTKNKFLASKYNMINLYDGSDSFHGIGIVVYEKDADNDHGSQINSIELSHKDNKGRIEIKAKNRIELKAPVIALSGSEVYINGSKLIDLKSEEKITGSCDEDIIFNGKKIEATSTEGMKATAGTDLEIGGINITATASGQLKAKGLATEVKADAALTLEGGAMATLKAPMVMIN